MPASLPAAVAEIAPAGTFAIYDRAVRVRAAAQQMAPAGLQVERSNGAADAAQMILGPVRPTAVSASGDTR
jgi:hypothetical protein